ncbi:hypothetical protein Q31b_43300 [Novipirellula aureliae]|uniref:Uncharacterized protein n=1 Tax=Novipirellula aureliae TaxID=2527966 RepID=A0A5C6DLQ8_9BACT|nr:hypothetical protein Q31b_43300 [Novipirellula aureliae]
MISFTPTLSPKQSCSRDPIGYEGGSNNIYEYVGSQPVKWIDPHGLEWNLGRNPPPGYGSPHDDGDLPSNQDKFDDWVKDESLRGDWWIGLPKCPSKICVLTLKTNSRLPREFFANPDPTDWHSPGPMGSNEGRYHPNGVYSMRSRSRNDASNQCVYDANGSLISGAPTHGTVDSSAPGSFPLAHYLDDVAAVELAASLDGCWDDGGFFGAGHIIEGCSGENMQKYFDLRPTWGESDPPDEDPCDPCKFPTLVPGTYSGPSPRR